LTNVPYGPTAELLALLFSFKVFLAVKYREKSFFSLLTAKFLAASARQCVPQARFAKPS
jgi:hypothetical protein